MKTKSYKNIHVCEHGINFKYCEKCQTGGNNYFPTQKRAALGVYGEWRGPSLSSDQQNAVNTVKHNNDDVFFLTGSAGTGKSLVIDYLKTTCDKVAVTATTGNAAQLIGGTTIQSFAGILAPPKGVVDSWPINKRIQNTDLLIVDEASMMNEELINSIIERFAKADHVPKLLLVGDFLQLPPIQGIPLYKTTMWPSINLIKLSSYHRHSEMDYVEVLNHVRCGKYSTEVKEFIQSRTVKELPDDCIHLMSDNKSVDTRNLRKIQELKTKCYTFRRDFDTEPDVKEITEKDMDRIRFPKELIIKEGARIVMLNNDKEKRWFNGSTGTVRAIYGASNVISVDLDYYGKVEVPITKEELFNVGGKRLGTAYQFPMLLAWAMTIHRSQGTTLDKVGINLNNHFADGQTYVAMSRCKSKNGISFCGNLTAIKTDAEAVKIFG